MSAALSPAMYEELASVARAAQAAGHGGKTPIYREAAQRMGISVPTLLARLKHVRVGKPRKRRSDAGVSALMRDEALMIAAIIEETRRLTGTGELSIGDAVSILRANGKIQAGRVDETTGEFLPLSESAISRAMMTYGCHPSQLAAVTAAVSVASEHPNHFWQIDASISRQFYLADGGTEQMPRAMYYRGKPKNFEAIKDRRLIRYDIVDHCTGHLRVFYALRAESALNVISALIHAMTPTPGIAMHGVPRLLGMDKGTESQALLAFCVAMGIQTWAHAAGNPRAIGSGERGQGLIETHFEAPLKLRDPVVSLAEIQRLADEWCAHYNATRTHSRTGLTRRDGWLRISPEQLRLAPPVEVLRELATTQPVECTVRDLAIRFKGARWDVRGMPGVLNDSKVQVAINAFDTDTVRVLTTGEDGKPAHYLAPRLQLGAWNFPVDAARAGEEFKRMPDTPADEVRKEISRLAMQVQTDAEAVAARKAKRTPFGGEIDPTKAWRKTEVMEALPRAGTPSQVEAPAIVEPTATIPMIRPQYVPTPLSHAEMARALKRRVEERGGAWSADQYARMAALWPDGVPEEQLDDCAVALMRGGLRAVMGGAQ
ncbi:MAG: hypothetical protein WDA70_03765 [Lysobacteraceae bacterium]